jgi:hypothetical protein
MRNYMNLGCADPRRSGLIIFYTVESDGFRTGRRKIIFLIDSFRPKYFFNNFVLAQNIFLIDPFLVIFFIDPFWRFLLINPFWRFFAN